MASLRREEEKARKAEKRQGGASKPTSAESVLARLRKGGEHEGVVVWVLRADGAEMVCRSWYRTSFCEAKKCRLSHNACLALSVRGLGVDDGAEAEEAVCEGPLDAASLSAKDLRFVRFIAVGDRLCFDWARPRVWTDWAEGQALPSLRALSITEEGEGEEGQDREKEALRPEKAGVCHLARIATSNRLGPMLAFLSVQELALLLSCSPRFKKAVLADDASRQRRKAAFGLISADVSRSRKQEKKKSQKRAFLGSTDKVDAYARGIDR